MGLRVRGSKLLLDVGYRLNLSLTESVVAMTTLLLALCLAVEGEPPRLLSSEVTAGVGLLGSGYAFTGGRLGEAQLAPVVTARGLLGGATLEGGLLLVVPTAGTTGVSFTASARLGWTGQRWSLLVGGLVQWAADARPALQWLPTLRGSVDFGEFGLTLGVFDSLGLIPAHLSIDLRVGRGSFSVGYVAPVGLLVSTQLPVAERFGVRVTAFAFKLAQTELAMVTVSGTFGGTP
jgi:hypothetical protein